MSDIQINLVDCTRVLLREIPDKRVAQKDVALTYAMAMKSLFQGADSPDWTAINTAIIERWSRSGLERVKTMAHKQLAEWDPAMTAPDTAAKAREIACRIAVDVAELPDRTSPDDYPNHMLVTAGELIDLIEARITAALEAHGNAEWNRAIKAAEAACEKQMRKKKGKPAQEIGCALCAVVVRALTRPQKDTPDGR